MMLRSALLLLGSLGLTSAALTYKGVDWSSLLIEEDAGKKYSNAAGTQQPLETILANTGVNTVRQRIWVNPSGGDYDLDYNLELAQRAQDAGLKIYLDFHYSDTWADPGHQTTPSAWANYDIDDLTWEIYNYTMDVMDAFQDAGIHLDIVSIGNEITAGLLWPLGQESSSSGGFYNIARLLHSASSGIADSSLSSKPQVMIHLDNGWNWDTQEWWYDSVLAEGPLTDDDYDIQGVSYYPFYNSAATLSSLKSSLTNMKSKYGKQVQVVETDWPSSCPSPAYSFPSDTTSIPFSAAGQATWVQDVANVVSAVGGNGFFYWEPAWLDNTNLGSSCEYVIMFDQSGKAMAGMAAFENI